MSVPQGKDMCSREALNIYCKLAQEEGVEYGKKPGHDWMVNLLEIFVSHASPHRV